MLVIMHLLDLLHQTEYEPGHWWKKQTDVGKQGKCMRGITKYSYFLLFKKNVLSTTFSCYGLHIIKTPREKKKEQWCQQINVCFNVHKQQSSIIEVLNIHFPGRSMSKLKQLTSSVGLIDICQKWKSSQTEQRFTWQCSKHHSSLTSTHGTVTLNDKFQ